MLCRGMLHVPKRITTQRDLCEGVHHTLTGSVFNNNDLSLTPMEIATHVIRHTLL
jgi:hypothetical protein